jgi:diguanylate cyclase (GGDEF)-like protein
MLIELGALAFFSCCMFTLRERIIVKREVYSDELTGLYNRKILKEVKNKKKEFYILACDIDHFKIVNDTYGHDAGDVVLKTVSNSLMNHFKENKDYVVRWGGEEFFIFIEADKNLTELIIFNRLDEIRKDIMNLNILSESMQVIKITMSFGFNFQSFSGEEIVEKGVKLSDDFLYYSKENGRNKVSFNGNVKEGEAA